MSETDERNTPEVIRGFGFLCTIYVCNIEQMNNNCTNSNSLIDGNPLLYEYCARTFHLINFFLLSVSMYIPLGIIDRM